MSIETNRPEQPNYNPNPAPQQPAPKRNNSAIYLIIIAVLLGLCIYLFLNRNQVAEQRDMAEVQYASSDSSRQAVEGEYNAALARLDELVSKNTQMDSVLTNKDSEISKLKRQIDAIVRDKNASKADLGKAKALIAEMNSKVKTYEERIAELEGQNQVLTQERDSTRTENSGLQQKVKLGAVLHASNIRMTPLDLRRGGKKEVETGKAKKVDVFRILFDIDENRIAENGKKEIFVRITGPDGVILSNAAYGSGVTTAADGQSVNYTMLKQIDLVQDQPVKDVTVDWNQDSNYKKGAYNIEFFNEGYKIGSGSVTLK
jgi:predicted RNase H-like nuclease (RuvC/YqgF family)